MAITVVSAFESATPFSTTFYATHDGQAGNSLSLSHAWVQSYTADGPLRNLLMRTYTGQIDARDKILGSIKSVIGGDALSRGLDVVIIPRDSVATVPWGFDVNVDNDGFPTLTITGIAAAASVALYRLEYRHSIDR